MNCLSWACCLVYYACEGIEKAWIRHGRALRADYLGFAFRKKAGNGKRHGDSVIAVRIDHRSGERRGADPQSIFELLDVGVHSAEVLGDCRYSVRFLNTQLAGVTDLDPAGQPRSGDRKNRYLIDQ